MPHRYKTRWKWSLAILVCLGGMVLTTSQSCLRSEKTISFNRDIRPILNENCLSCHGGVRQLGEFSLLFQEEAMQAGESGKLPIVAGQADQSEIIRRIRHHDPEERMPLDAEPLAESDIQLLEQWIEEGAEWEEQWSLIAPKAQTLPKNRTAWGTGAIDPFVLAKLEQNGLTPNPPADRLTLARRLSLDLMGVPLPYEQALAFAQDSSENAILNLVDRLLASPHFGERWAALWLDLARYADSKGYEKDPDRSIWQYRDWVIRAFNDDMPFDQFTIEQLAGDLLPEADQNQLIATAFHRNTMTNTEGGTDDEEYRVAAVLDRVNTTFEVWQGLTMSCVQCHSHPYDPFRQKEYYQLFDFFNQSLDGDIDTDLPLVESYTKDQLEKIQKLTDRILQINPRHRLKAGLRPDQQLKAALFPRIIPFHIDEFDNILIYGDGKLSNWSNQVNEQKNKVFSFRLFDIGLTDLHHIDFTYSAQGGDARVDIYLDSLGGEKIGSHRFGSTNGLRSAEWAGSNRFNRISVNVSKSEGQHDLVFHVVNTTGKVPDGIIMLEEMWLAYADHLRLLPTEKRWGDSLIALQGQAIKTPVFRDRKQSRATHVFERGNWLVKGEKVSASVPGSLPTLAPAPSQNRLSLARWLVSKKNPLTARVMVNRFWEQLFGNGIVQTTGDFGSQGIPPTHPALLDHLAWRWMHTHQWQLKPLLKEIVLSATYQQATFLSSVKLEKDPYNLLLSRGPRVRLSAEQIRDQALAISGQLNPKMYGKPVMPPQPEGIWQSVYNASTWETSPGDEQFRRAIYTYWKRTSPYPSMISFDSPSREFCVSRRIRTNTPLQALVSLNDPVYLSAARAFSQSIDPMLSEEERIRKLYQKAVYREIDSLSFATLFQLYQSAHIEYLHDPDAAVAMTQSSDQADAAALVVLANAVMNLDAFIMKE